MVAYTHPDCLPYFEGGDSPCLNTGTVCDPSTVDCDFAAAVELKLDEFDEVVTVIDNPPIAWVETLVPMVVSAGSLEDEPVVFTTVRVDTANMVNLDANPTGITITRTGIYSMMLYVRCVTDIAIAGDFIELGIITTAAPPPAAFPLTDTTFGSYQAINLDLVELAPGVNMTTYYEQGQVVSFFLNANGATGGFITTSKISFGMAWLGDVL